MPTVSADEVGVRVGPVPSVFGSCAADRDRVKTAGMSRARHHDEPVGITAVGWYLPDHTMTAAEVADRAGVGLEVITDHIGLGVKRIAGPDDHPSEMATKAGRHALERGGLDPDDIDLVIFTGEGPADWNGWSPAASIQHRLGIHGAFAFDLHNACCGANVAMTVAAGLMHRDPDVRTALIVTAVRFSDLVEYADPASHGLWTFADGATAAVVRRDEPSNTILAYAEVTEPDVADLVRIPLGGTRIPYAGDPELLAMSKYHVEDPARFDDVLHRIYVDRYVEVAQIALERSGHAGSEVDFLLTNQLAVGVMNQIHERLGVPVANTMRTIDTVGHIGPGDTLLNLGRAIDADRIHPGDLVVLATSGLGCSWASTVVQY